MSGKFKLKNFKQFVNESPMINTYLSKERMKDHSEKFRNTVLEPNHNTSSSIGGNYYHNNTKDGDHHYYRRTPDGKIKEYSVIKNNVYQSYKGDDGNIVIKNNVHSFSNKGDDGNSEHIKNFMIHHASKHGIVHSDEQNTFGSKQVWMNLIKNKPEKFNIEHSYKNKIINPNVDLDYIHKNENNIWNTQNEALKHTLSLRKE